MESKVEYFLPAIVGEGCALKLLVRQLSSQFIFFPVKDMRFLVLFWSIGFIFGEQTLRQQTEGCCSNCLAKPNINGVDALDFDKCSNAENAGCCFEDECHMSRLGNDITYDSGLKFEGTKPVVLSGRWIQLQWSSAERLTYIIVNEGQTKSTQPKNGSTEAQFRQGWFQMCAQNAGSVFFRGWRDNGCSASVEMEVIVQSSGDNVQCSSQPTVPKSSGECNPTRGTINAQGECECASDWAGPPECNDLPLWKWLVTIGGGLAAIVSIAVSIHAYCQRRKRKHRDSLSFHEAPSKTNPVDVLRVSPRNHSPAQASYVQDAKLVEPPRECTL